MTDRSSIEPDALGIRWLSYTTRCGWIDWGHANSEYPTDLVQQIRSGLSTSPLYRNTPIDFDGAPAYFVEFNQNMHARIPKTKTILTYGPYKRYVIEKGLSAQLKERVILSVYLHAIYNFEKFQGSWWRYFVSGHSSFSIEDLPSDMLGLYGAMGNEPIEGFRKACGETTVEQSYRIWDHSISGDFSKMKNKTLEPILFDVLDENNKPLKVDTTPPDFIHKLEPLAIGEHWAPFNKKHGYSQTRLGINRKRLTRTPYNLIVVDAVGNEVE